jgi:hypothetical protein
VAIKPATAIIGIGAAALVAGLAWFGMKQAAFAHIAVGFAAKQTCSCLFVSGRTMQSCMSDFPADSRDLLTIAPAGNRVSASTALGLFSAEATYEDGLGCRIVK